MLFKLIMEELMKILIENSSNKGQIVLDPFMGIGSTGIACIKADRKFIGIELDPRYFEIAKNEMLVFERENQMDISDFV